jgi:Ca-activated chloride channel homolog
MGRNDNFYTRLGIPFDASPEEIRRAYREAALRHHPDTREEGGKTELFLGIQEAFEVLSDPKGRIAYDARLPSETFSPPEVKLKTIYSRSSLYQADDPQLLYILLELQSYAQIEELDTPPLVLGLVLDTSTSMQGEVLDGVKSTAVALARSLRPQDVFTLVTFSDRAEVRIPAGYNLDIKKAETAIQMIRAQGGTEIFSGIRAAYTEISHYRSSKTLNHLIVITDGKTYGDEQDCLQLARQAAEEGIVINALGLGSKWNEQFLDALASATGGSCRYVVRPNDVHRFLKDQFGAFSSRYADRVAYAFAPLPAEINLNYVLRLEPEPAPLETGPPIQLGWIDAGSRLSVLLELELKGLSPYSGDLILTEGRLEIDIPSRQESKCFLRLKTELPVLDKTEKEEPPRQMIEAVRKMVLFRLQERAQTEAARGEVHRATSTLKHLANQLMADGERGLATTVLNEAANLNIHGSLSEEGKKQMNFGTRSFLLPSPKQTKIKPG